MYAVVVKKSGHFDLIFTATYNFSATAEVNRLSVRLLKTMSLKSFLSKHHRSTSASIPKNWTSNLKMSAGVVFNQLCFTLDNFHRLPLFLCHLNLKQKFILAPNTTKVTPRSQNQPSRNKVDAARTSR